MRGFLTPEPRCTGCGADFSEHAVGDGAVFIVLTILCFVAVAVALSLEFAMSPPLWVHGIVATALVGVLTAVLLPLVTRFMLAQSMVMGAGQRHDEARTAEPGEAE